MPSNLSSDQAFPLAARLQQLEADNRALRAINAQARQILRSAVDFAIITMNGDGTITGWNRGAQNIIGYTAADVLGQSGELVYTPEDRAGNRFTIEMSQAVATGSAENERWHIRRDGSRFWASGKLMPLLDGDGAPDGFLAIMQDRSLQQRDADNRELMLAEMTHRMKNSFSTVLAVAAQTGRHTPDPKAFQSALTRRLSALAQAHDMLFAGNWQDAPLRSVVESALASHAETPGRVSIEGPAVLLAADRVQSLTLAFHELATNAEKHGALSVPGGRVEVCWEIVPADAAGHWIELHWEEFRGPHVSPPTRRGFGTQLLGRGLGLPPDALKLDFLPAGLQCRIRLPFGEG